MQIVRSGGPVASYSVKVIDSVRLGGGRVWVDGESHAADVGHWAFYIPALQIKLLHAIDGQCHGTPISAPDRAALFSNQPIALRPRYSREDWIAAFSKTVARRAAENFVASRRLHEAGIGPEVFGLCIVRSFEAEYSPAPCTTAGIIVAMVIFTVLNVDLANVVYETPEGRKVWKLKPLQLLVTLIGVLFAAQELHGLTFKERPDLPGGLAGAVEGLDLEAVDDRAFVELLSAVGVTLGGPGGPYHRDTPGAWSDSPGVRGSAQIHDEEFKACVALQAQYVLDTFGKFPGTVPTVFILNYVQAHHLDLDFYDRHFTPGAYLRSHAEHMRRWHDRPEEG
jgi:hypothetical protein